MGTTEREKVTVIILTLVSVLVVASADASFCFAQTTQTDWLKIIGGPTDDYPVDLARAADGGYVILGSTSITTQYGLTDTCWVIKVDQSGNVEWNKTYSKTGLLYGQSICQIGNEYFVAGNTVSNPPNGWLARLNSFGEIVANKIYDFNQGITAVPGDNGLFTFSFANTDAIITKTDLQGNIQWSRNYGGSETDWFGDIFQTAEGN